MLKNNNQAVIRKMAVRSIRSNRKKNSLYLVAIVLAVLMLFTVMQTGASYMHMQYVWRLHSVGELYDGILMGGVTKEQEETVKADPGIPDRKCRRDRYELVQGCGNGRYLWRYQYAEVADGRVQG